jgi:serine/threonine protein phosphatase PrpC
MQLRGATASHVGNVRDNNQDRVHFGGYTGVVADGMGGHQGGEMAASIAISEFVDVVDPIPPGGLVELVEEANRAVFERAADPDLRGMGTTLVALTLRPTEEKVSVVNVGDSRAYFLRGDEFGQLTLDHSLVEDLVRQNRLTRDEALTHPQRNILTRALGIASQVEVDRFLMPTRVGDRFLLCSDGLFNEVTEEGIIGILQDSAEPNEAADRLVAAAIAAAGRDNVTVAVIDVVPVGKGGDVSSQAAETLLVPVAGGPAGSGEVLEMNAGGGVARGGGAAAGVDLAEPPVDVDADQIYDEVLEAEQAPYAEPELAEPSVKLELDEANEPAGHLVLNLDDETGLARGDDTAGRALGTPKKRRRGLRRFLAIGGLLAIAIVFYLGVNTWANSVWYVDTVGAVEGEETLAVFRGRPEGFLWTKPTQEVVLDDRFSQLTAESKNRVLAHGTHSSEAEALLFIGTLEREAALTGEDLTAAVDDVATTAAADELEDVADDLDSTDGTNGTATDNTGAEAEDPEANTGS